jgi:hypothetical protein
LILFADTDAQAENLGVRQITENQLELVENQTTTSNRCSQTYPAHPRDMRPLKAMWVAVCQAHLMGLRARRDELSSRRKATLDIQLESLCRLKNSLAILNGYGDGE